MWSWNLKLILFWSTQSTIWAFFRFWITFSNKQRTAILASLLCQRVFLIANQIFSTIKSNGLNLNKILSPWNISLLSPFNILHCCFIVSRHFEWWILSPKYFKQCLTSCPRSIWNSPGFTRCCCQFHFLYTSENGLDKTRFNETLSGIKIQSINICHSMLIRRTNCKLEGINPPKTAFLFCYLEHSSWFNATGVKRLEDVRKCMWFLFMLVAMPLSDQAIIKPFESREFRSDISMSIALQHFIVLIILHIFVCCALFECKIPLLLLPSKLISWFHHPAQFLSR